MPKTLQSNLGLTELEGDCLHKQIKRIWNDVATCKPFSAHLFSSLSSCWRGKHPSAVQPCLNTGLSTRASPFPPLFSPTSPVKLHFRLKAPYALRKKSPRSGAGRGKRALPRPKSCYRKGWLLGNISAYPASSGLDRPRFIAVCFCFLGHKGSPGQLAQRWRNSTPDGPQTPAWSRGWGAAFGQQSQCMCPYACRRAVTSEHHIKPQNVSINIVSHLGEQSMLLYERQRWL